MKIELDKIPPDGIRLNISDPPYIVDIQDRMAKFNKPIAIEADVTLKNADLFVKTDVQTPVHFTCSRCLDEFDANVTSCNEYYIKVKP